MKKIFNEYGGWIIIVFVIIALLLLAGGIKSIDDNGKVTGTGLIATVGNMLSDTIEKNNNHLRYLNGECGPNGEPLVSTTESQVGKYADVDGDGEIDGIIFADLLLGGSGECGTNGEGKYTITKITSCKDYYISQNSYTNKLGGKAEVLAPIGTGENRFYVMSLNDVSSDEYIWYYSAYCNMKDYVTTTSQKFGKGKNNTGTMIDKWDSNAYGEQNTSTYYKDIWGEIKNEYTDGWFLPSKQEWASFANEINITA